MRKKQWIFLSLTILSTWFIFSNSMQPAVDSGAQSGWIVSFVENFFRCCGFVIAPGALTNLVRKAAHVTEFFLQGLFFGLFLLSLQKKFSRQVIYLLFLGLFTACTDEFLQNFYAGRGSLVSDIFIDFSGVLLSAVVCLFIDWCHQRKGGVWAWIICFLFWFLVISSISFWLLQWCASSDVIRWFLWRGCFVLSHFPFWDLCFFWCLVLA